MSALMTHGPALSVPVTIACVLGLVQIKKYLFGNRRPNETAQESFASAWAEYDSLCQAMDRLHNKTGEYTGIDDATFATKKNKLEHRITAAAKRMETYHRQMNDSATAS